MCLAVPGKVVHLRDEDDTRMAEVDFGGVRKDVCLQYIPDVELGDYVIVHVGFAIQRLDESSARETLASFENLGYLEEEFGDQLALARRQAGMDEESTAGKGELP
ncbi:HypC/HybG/HupF family hydrogenase formation chaperone [Sciscionella marina]|uniref:HypC/HybG/HupF family hydrogenase formation chaperone n=1 Tax=Sciscionella marina TaxID=508770 RepID=UPI0003793512|nr:HypC/HybG/HupF family hydrogenase formation chaperone [Sciscionella marina]